jgi:hypothetical protein
MVFRSKPMHDILASHVPPVTLCGLYLPYKFLRADETASLTAPGVLLEPLEVGAKQRLFQQGSARSGCSFSRAKEKFGG